MNDERFHFQIGEFHCLAVNDGGYAGNSEMLFNNAPPEELEQKLLLYEEKPDHIPSTWTCLLVKTDHHVVLIDTGLGSGQAYGGNLLPALEKEGISANDIDTVILTHGHPDHIGGSVTENGEITFPKATYYMWQEEWAFWTSETARQKASSWSANFAQQKLTPLTPVMNTIKEEMEIVPGIQVLAAPGHTVGHSAVHITSDGEQLLFLADVALHPIHLEHPNWYGEVDQDPEQTVATRQKMFRWAAANKSLVLAFHFLPFPSLGTIINHGDVWQWKTIDLAA